MMMMMMMMRHALRVEQVERINTHTYTHSLDRKRANHTKPAWSRRRRRRFVHTVKQPVPFYSHSFSLPISPIFRRSVE